MFTENKLFKLVINKEWHPNTSLTVLAKDEQEARQLCYNCNKYDPWLSEDDCTVTQYDTSVSQVIDVMILSAFA